RSSKLLFAAPRRNLGYDLPIAVENKTLRHSNDVKCRANLALRVQQHSKRVVLLSDKFLNRLTILVRDCENNQPLFLKLMRQLFKNWKLSSTWGAPCRPEIEKDYFTVKRCQRVLLAIKPSQNETRLLVYLISQVEQGYCCLYLGQLLGR